MSCETLTMAAPFRVKALYEYTSPHEDDLNFPLGQVITVTDEEDAEWYGGEYVDDAGSKKEGIFPRNFVEKFEPTPPPRPTRTRTKKAEDPQPQQPEPEPEEEPEPEPVAVPPTPVAPVPVPSKAPEPEPKAETPKSPEPKSPVIPTQAPPKPAAPAAEAPKPAPREAPAAAAPAPVPAPKSKASGPPPVAEKPSSFKDRIAAFNKPAAPPIAPFKPSGLGGSGFIKKPFVPPPPSRDAYVPVQREQVTQKIYRRSEDPEIKEQEAENQENAEKAGLYATDDKREGAEEDDQPKPTSLKERIALLAKQQQEQAQRHADAAAKKEKPKKPAKKKPETPLAEPAEDAADDTEFTPLERKDTETTIGRTSMEEQAPMQSPPPPRRKASKGPAVESPHDGNEADMSGAGDTTEGQDDTSEREDDDEPKRPISQAPPPPTLSRTPTARDDKQPSTEARDEAPAEEEDEEEEEEEDDIDPELKRKEELRARMAKMSGGMGFHGMFGAPVPPAGGLPKRAKAERPAKDETESREDSVQRSAPPVPTPMALPGMGGLQKSKEREPEDDEDDEPASLPSPPPVPRRAPVIPETDDADAEQDKSEDDDATPGQEAPRAAPPVPGGRPAPPPVPAERT